MNRRKLVSNAAGGSAEICVNPRPKLEFGEEFVVHFYLVRHAHADWQPDEQRSLSARGKLATAHVAAVLMPYPITTIYASPYRRASETVEPFAQQRGLSIVTLPALRERQLAGEPAVDFATAVEAV